MIYCRQKSAGGRGWLSLCESFSQLSKRTGVESEDGWTSAAVHLLYLDSNEVSDRYFMVDR